MMQHWAIRYFGKPWVSGGTGPDEYDCWGLVRAVQKDIYGREMPAVNVDAHDHEAILNAFAQSTEYQNWVQVDTPQEGDCVITKSNPIDAEHVGIWLDVDGGRILQAVYGSGVVIVTLEATQKCIGQHVEFWRYNR